MRCAMIYSLYGIGGLYNYGCEAIIRGTVEQLKKIDPNCTINYFSYYYNYDREIIKDLDINVIPIVKTRRLLVRGYNKIIRTIGLNHQLLCVPTSEIIENTDIMISIGGDIYTIPEHLRRNDKYPYYNELIEVGAKVINAGKEVIVYGASVGPFGDYDRAVRYYLTNLEKYKYIICRETESISYLRSIGCNNTMFMPDPAFSVHVSGEVEHEVYANPMIGLNFSPLSFSEVNGDSDEDDISALISVVEEIIDITQKDILLIPHVISPDPNDNDLIVLEDIFNHIGDKYRTRVHLADYKNGFLGIKRQIEKECCLIASARMHLCISAVERNIPTIFISYSQKSVGMCEYVYGNNYWVVNLADINSVLVNKIAEMNNSLKEVSDFLKKRNSEIMNDNEEAINNLVHYNTRR